MVLGMAIRAFALDIPIWQKHLLNRIIELFHRAFGNQILCLELPVDILARLLILRRIGGVKIVKLDMKSIEISFMLLPYTLYQLPRCNTLLLGAKHNWRTVRIISAHIMYLVCLHFLKTYPDIRLDVFHQMAEMDAAVGIRQCRSNQNFSLVHQLSMEIAKRDCNKLWAWRACRTEGEGRLACV